MTLAMYLFAPGSSDVRDISFVARGERDQTNVRDIGGDERERTLVARIRAGDMAAFQEVYTAHYADVLIVAASLLRARDEAEDVVQQVFAELWERRAVWRPHRIGPALIRAVRHRALDVLRRAHRIDGGDLADVIVASPAADAADVALEYAELERAVAAAVAVLPERRRTALLLRALRQLSYAEIGEVLDVSEKGAFLLVSRARDTLEPLRARFLESGPV